MDPWSGMHLGSNNAPATCQRMLWLAHSGVLLVMRAVEVAASWERGTLEWLVHCECCHQTRLFSVVVVKGGESNRRCEEVESVWHGVLLYELLEREGIVHCRAGVKWASDVHGNAPRKKIALWPGRSVLSPLHCRSSFLWTVGFTGFVNWTQVTAQLFSFCFSGFWFIVCFVTASGFANEGWCVALLIIMAVFLDVWQLKEASCTQIPSACVASFVSFILPAFCVVKMLLVMAACAVLTSLTITASQALGSACWELERRYCTSWKTLPVTFVTPQLYSCSTCVLWSTANVTVAPPPQTD